MAPGADDGGAQPRAGRSFDEALAALSMLGFARAPAEKVLRGVLRESPAAPVEELIRMALKNSESAIPEVRICRMCGRKP